MAVKAPKEGTGGNFVEQELLDPASYPARVVQVVDLGIQAQRPYMGQEKPPAHEVLLTYELVDEFLKDEDGNELLDKPRWLSESFAIRALDADLAKSNKRLAALDPEGVYEGDFSQVLDTPILVTAVHNKKGDKTYVNVGGLSPMRPRDAAKCPELVNEAVYFDLDEPDLDVFNSLPQWIRERIVANLNFAGSPLAELIGEDAGDAAKEKQKEKAKPAAKRAKAKKEEEPPFDPDSDDDGDEDSPY